MRSEMVDWKGYFPALTTPFRSTGELDIPRFRRQIELSLEQGAHGMVIGGSSGEWNALSFGERVELFSVAAQSVAGKVPVIAGISALDPKESKRLADEAAAVGASGVLVSVPPYALPTEAEALVFFRGWPVCPVAGDGIQLAARDGIPDFVHVGCRACGD